MMRPHLARRTIRATACLNVCTTRPKLATCCARHQRILSAAYGAHQAVLFGLLYLGQCNHLLAPGKELLGPTLAYMSPTQGSDFLRGMVW